MFRRRVIWTSVVILLVVVFGLAAGWQLLNRGPSVLRSSTAPQPVATINGVAITQAMIDRELKISRLNVAQPLSPLTGEDLERAEEEALNQLLTRQIILQAARRQNFAVDPEFIEERADLLFGGSGDEALESALTQIEATRADLLWWVGEIVTVEEFTTRVIMADALPEERQEAYNEWFNTQRAQADIEIFLDGQSPPVYALVGEIAPDFTLTSLDDHTTSLSDYAGKVVLVNFWATWCPSCITEMSDYERVYQQHQTDFMVLGVNLQENDQHVRQYAKDLGLSFPVLLDNDGTVTNHQYQVTGMPGSFIIDREGKIYYRHLGPMTAETLTAKLKELGL